MNGLYIGQRAFQHIVRDGILKEPEVIQAGTLIGHAFDPETASHQEFAQFLDLCRKDAPSIPE
jgi:hypothetical protein